MRACGGARYGDESRLVQTFILPPRTGAVYKADNWTCLGMTKGEAEVTRTIYDGEAAPGAEVRTFGNGEVKTLVRSFVQTAPKLIFVRHPGGYGRTK